MASTQVVNFRADSISYQKTKEILADEKITVSDVLNAALRKIANGTVDAKEFVSASGIVIADQLHFLVNSL